MQQQDEKLIMPKQKLFTTQNKRKDSSIVAPIDAAKEVFLEQDISK